MNDDQILDDELVLQQQVQERKYAGFWIRTGASLIDIFVLLVPKLYKI